MMILQLLRNIKASSDADDYGSLMNAISASNDWLAEHDANQIEYADAIGAARDQYHVDGEVELDDEVFLSPGDDPGIYVSAWVWVDFE
jgi:hypothetical protein